MRYLLIYSAPGRELFRDVAATPVGALRAAIDRQAEGFANIRLVDVTTGVEYSVQDFGKAHDLSLLMDAPSKVVWISDAALAR